MQDVPIDRIMTPDPATIGPQETVAEARRILETDAINHLPVVEGDRLVGIISSSDLLKLHLFDEKAPLVEAATVGQIMQTSVIVIDRGATMREAAEKLSMGSFHALPVIDRKRRLHGIVTSSDLLGELLRRIG